MGCNESKHDVATGDTIIRRPSSILRKKSTQKYQQLETNDNTKSFSKKDENNVATGEGEEGGGGGGRMEMENMSVNTETMEEVGKSHEHGKSITSPDQYFSSRKDEDAVESIATTDEGYFSPQPGSAKDVDFFTMADEAKDVDEKESLAEVVDEVKENNLVDQSVKKADNVTGNSQALKESDLTNEAIKTPTTQIIGLVEENKTVVVLEEKSSETSTKASHDVLK